MKIMYNMQNIKSNKKDTLLPLFNLQNSNNVTNHFQLLILNLDTIYYNILLFDNIFLTIDDIKKKETKQIAEIYQIDRQIQNIQKANHNNKLKEPTRQEKLMTIEIRKLSIELSSIYRDQITYKAVFYNKIKDLYKNFYNNINSLLLKLPIDTIISYLKNIEITDIRRVIQKFIYLYNHMCNIQTEIKLFIVNRNLSIKQLILILKKINDDNMNEDMKLIEEAHDIKKHILNIFKNIQQYDTILYFIIQYYVWYHLFIQNIVPKYEKSLDLLQEEYNLILNILGRIKTI